MAYTVPASMSVTKGTPAGEKASSRGFCIPEAYTEIETPFGARRMRSVAKAPVRIFSGTSRMALVRVVGMVCERFAFGAFLGFNSLKICKGVVSDEKYCTEK